jgi:hypothetical protein
MGNAEFLMSHIGPKKLKTFHVLFEAAVKGYIYVYEVDDLKGLVFEILPLFPHCLLTQWRRTNLTS